MKQTSIYILRVIVLSVLLSTNIQAQNVGVGTNTPHASAKLDVSSTTQGFLPPRMTEAQRDAISNPVAGLIIYCTDCTAIQYYDGTTWNSLCFKPPLPLSNPTQLGADIDGESVADFSGGSVSLSADGATLAIAASFNNGNGSQAGHVRVYAWSGTAWAQQGTDIDGEAAYDNSGWSVSLSADGSTLAIGALNNDGNGNKAGHVRVYNWSGTAWTQQGADIDGESVSDWSGHCVFLSADGSTVAIGAPTNDGNGTNAGHVRVYAWSGTAWVQQGADIDGEAVSDLSGVSVSLSANGSTLAIGADGNDGNGVNAGHVRVYKWSGTAWIQQGLDIDGEAAGDESGGCVSLSANGSTLAIGASYNSGSGSNSGHVRVYHWSGTAWTQQGVDIDGEAAGDFSGRSVSLSADGTTLAIGAEFNNGNGNQSGHVRVFR